jgi:SAM-dependent methyltransferase
MMNETMDKCAVTTVPSCPICESGALTTLFEVQGWAKYQIIQCTGCSGVFSWPRPSPRELDAFYTSEYFTRSQNDGHGYSDYRSMAELNARRMWHDLKKFAPLDSVQPRRVLDIGCATGGFLAEAKADGWTCVGVELSEYAVDVARNELGLEVFQGDAFLPALDPGSFGMITMYHVLEHLIDPIGTLRRVLELLAPGGLLFVELPNWDSFGRVVKGAGWKQIKPPEHINYLNPRSLRVAAERSRFEVVQCDTHYPSLMDRAAVRRITQTLHLGIAAIAKLACQFGHGGYGRLLARKPSV